jgi:hypothetical protein
LSVMKDSDAAPVSDVTPMSAVSASVVSVSSPAVSSAIEDSYDFEEIFKPLLEELSQEIFQWDTQA